MTDKYEEAQHQLEEAIHEYESKVQPPPRPRRVVTTALPKWMRLDLIALAGILFALAVGVSDNLVAHYQQADSQAQTNKSLLSVQHKDNQALCILVQDSEAGALRRKEVLSVATKLHRLVVELPAGPAREAVAAVEHVFYVSGHGNAPARKAFNKELENLGCKVRI